MIEAQKEMALTNARMGAELLYQVVNAGTPLDEPIPWGVETQTLREVLEPLRKRLNEVLGDERR